MEFEDEEEEPVKPTRGRGRGGRGGRGGGGRGCLKKPAAASHGRGRGCLKKPAAADRAFLGEKGDLPKDERPRASESLGEVVPAETSKKTNTKTGETKLSKKRPCESKSDGAEGVVAKKARNTFARRPRPKETANPASIAKWHGLGQFYDNQIGPLLCAPSKYEDLLVCLNICCSRN